MCEKRNNSICLYLGIIWILTLLGGLLGRWNSVTAPLLVVISAILTIACIISMNNKKQCNIHLGICSQYLQILFLISAYKMLYWQFTIPAWHLFGGIVVFILLNLFVVWKFVKNNKETKEVKSVNAWATGGVGFLIATIFTRYIRGFNLENPNVVASLIIAGSLIAFALLMSLGVRYLVLEDDRVLFPE